MTQTTSPQQGARESEPASAASAQAGARAKKTKRSADLSDLGVSSYGEWSREELEFVSSLARTHPRQFWSSAKRFLTERSAQDRSLTALNAFKHSEVLLRAGLSLALKKSGMNGFGSNLAIESMLSGCLALPNKSEAFYLERARSAAAQLSKTSASSIFSILLAPAVAGNASAALAMAQQMPSAGSANPDEARRHTYGASGFASHGLNDSAHNAATIAFIHAQENGLSPKPLPARERCSNAFFWIAHRYLESQAAGSASASLWEQAGCLIAQRCPSIADGTQTLALALGIEPFRKALMAGRPVLSNPSFYGFHRPQILLDALQMAPAAEVAEILQYASSGRSPELQASSDPALPPAFTAGLPGWSIALLAGHTPDPAWMPEPESPEALGVFKLPKAVIALAKSGALAPSRMEREWMGDTGASLNAAKLCKALGRAWGPVAKASRATKKAPSL